MIGRRTRDASSVDKNGIPWLQVRSVLRKFESERFFTRNNRCPGNSPERLQAEFKPAVVQKIRHLLIGRPSLTLDQPCETAEITKFRRLTRGVAGSRAIAEDIRSGFTSIPGP